MAAANDFLRPALQERVPRPFVIGVAGGTASGKVCLSSHALYKLSLVPFSFN